MEELRDNGVLKLDIEWKQVELSEEDLLIETGTDAKAMYQKQTVNHPLFLIQI